MIENRKIIAVDFDGTLFEEHPDNHIGAPIWKVINYCLQEQKQGSELILWTCREDKLLQDALKACHSVGLHFDHINENSPDDDYYDKSIKRRKVYATIYLDNKAMRPEDILS